MKLEKNLKKNIATLVLGATLAGAAVTTAAVAVPNLAGAAAATETPADTPQRGQIVQGVLADLVADGTITQAQADAVSTALQAKGGAIRDRIKARLSESADQLAAFFGITVDELKEELKSGKSLAQVAEAHGKSRDELIAAMTDAVNTRVDEAVAAGKLTAEQGDKIKEKAPERIAQIVDRVPGSGNGGRGGNGGGRLGRNAPTGA